MSFLSEKAVLDYMEIYKQELSVEISCEEARKQAENFIHLISLFWFSNSSENGR